MTSARGWILAAALAALPACDNQPLTGASDGGAPDLAVVADAGHAPTNHRADDSQCSTTPAAGNCMIGGGGGACSSDSSCTAGSNGRCVESMGGALFCSCSYDACKHDTDCPTNQLCACHGSPFVGGAGNACVDGNCRVDSDCGAHGYCSPSHGSAGCGGLNGYYCHTSADKCTNDSDCVSSAGADVCAWSATDSRWQCQQPLLCP